MAYCGYGEVNWCEALGTVLANDEVVNGVSERGGYPVVKKKLRQWYLRITEYADRLLEGLQTVDFSEAMKEMQTNWIGKVNGAEITFASTPSPPLAEKESSNFISNTASLSEENEKLSVVLLNCSHYYKPKQYEGKRKNPTEAEEYFMATSLKIIY